MTKPPKMIAGLSQISDQYDTILCDVWGVIHNGVTPFAASVQALRQFREHHGKVILITNSPRPASEIPAQFDQIGVSHDCYDAIVTSGDATRSELQSRAPGPVYILGPKRDLPLYDGLGLQTSELEDAAFISCTGLLNDRSETPDDYINLLKKALDFNLLMVCANPDIVVMIGDQRIWCGGALAEVYGQLGGEVLYAGKPHMPIYQLCFSEVAKLTGKAADRKRILAIGDGVATDILGAQTAGVDSLFVATGLDAGIDATTGELETEQLMADLVQVKTRARFRAAGLVW